MEIENSFDGKLILSEQELFPKTKKKNKELHGMGMVNIKSVAEKYQGAIAWMAEGNVFTLSVMLKDVYINET